MSGNCTARMMSSTRVRFSAAESSVWMSSTSSIWSPTVMTGLSAVMGSWKTIAMREPRRSRSCAGVLVVISSPASLIEPPVRASWPFGSNPMTACAVTDLPDPDSPTMQRISPGPTLNDTLSIALARSARKGSRTVTLSRLRTGSDMSDALRHFRIERIAQTVAKHVHGEHGQREKRPWEHDVMREQPEELAPFSHDVPPGRRRCRYADTEE